MVYGDFRRSSYAWQSSKFYILLTLTFAVFVDIFLANFLVPILPHILEVRFGLEGDNVQSSMSTVLSFYGLAMFILSPVMGILVDKFSSRKSPLLIGLIAQIVTTCLTAVSPNVAFLCFSRIFQGAAASLLWIASLTTIADTVGSGDMGKTLGVIGPVVSTGAFFGPMTGGLLLSSAGYWHTWSAAVAMIALDLILRLAMIDKPKVSTMTHEADAGTFNEAEVDRESGAQDPGKHSPLNSLTTSHAATRQPKSSSPTISTAKSPMPNRVPPLSSPAVEEATPLLASDTNLSSPSSVRPLSNLAFFLFILRQRRVLSSLIVNIILMSAFNSFNATLALHVQELFHWGPRQVGFLYLALVGPSVLLGPFAGWLRDTIGVRWPTLVGTGFATPLYVVIGLVGDKRFPLMRGELGKRIYIGALALMGVAIELTTGSCMVEGTLVIDELEARNPGIFGPQGGYSRFFSITSMLFPLASLIGPLISGALTVRFNYAVMNNVMAALTFVSFLITLFFIGPRKARPAA